MLKRRTPSAWTIGGDAPRIARHVCEHNTQVCLAKRVLNQLLKKVTIFVELVGCFAGLDILDPKKFVSYLAKRRVLECRYTDDRAITMSISPHAAHCYIIRCSVPTPTPFRNESNVIITADQLWWWIADQSDATPSWLVYNPSPAAWHFNNLQFEGHSLIYKHIKHALRKEAGWRY
jgi:hypothetical protein